MYIQKHHKSQEELPRVARCCFMH